MSKLIIAESRGHGKACAGQKRTATIQVQSHCGKGYQILKQFRFTVSDAQSRARALLRAERFIETQGG